MGISGNQGSSLQKLTAEDHCTLSCLWLKIFDFTSFLFFMFDLGDGCSIPIDFVILGHIVNESMFYLMC